jgi:hypothetical protein
MEKAISTAFFIIISMIMALMLFNAAYPAIVEGGDSIIRMADRAQTRMMSQIAIVHGTGELDAAGWWQDTNSSGEFDIFLWVKNIGSSRVTALETLDVFFGTEGNFVRIPHQDAAGGSYPYWSAVVENGGDWEPSSTLCITVHYNAALPSGRYFAKVTTPTGISDEFYLGI